MSKQGITYPTYNPQASQTANQQYTQSNATSNRSTRRRQYRLQQRQNQTAQFRENNVPASQYSPEQIQSLYQQNQLPRGIYATDVARPPNPSTSGTARLLSTSGPSVAPQNRPGIGTRPSTYPERYNKTTPLYASQTNVSFNPAQIVHLNQRSARTTRLPTRASSASKYSLANLQQEWDAQGDKGTYDSTYFQQPIIGHIPTSPLEQVEEDLDEKHCRCIAHIEASYLSRIATAVGQERQHPSDPKIQLNAQDEERKFQSVPYARCMMQYRGPLRQLEDEGLQVAGTPVGECGSNYKFDGMPTKEDYAIAMARMRAYPQFFKNLPDYTSNGQQLEAMRPTILNMLHNWQNNKVPLRAPANFLD